MFQELLDLPSACHDDEVNNVVLASPSTSSKLQDSAAVTFSPKLEFEDGDIDDDLDPAMKEELDRLDEYINWGIQINVMNSPFDFSQITAIMLIMFPGEPQRLLKLYGTASNTANSLPQKCMSKEPLL